MRWYRIELFDKKTGKGRLIPSLAGSGMPPGIITSELQDGSTNPGALNIEFDITQYALHVGGATSYLRIWGLSIGELSQSFNLNPARDGSATTGVRISVGMNKGYPLVNPNQRNLIIEGDVLQAFGNWIGTDMTLDMFFQPSAGTEDAPMNFSFTWAKSETLSTLLARVFKQVLPAAKQSINVSASRVSNEDKVGYYQTFVQFAQAIKDLTTGQINADDRGVAMGYDGKIVRAFEVAPENTPGSIKQIAFQDLLGQVTYIAPQTITAKLVMRGDLDIDDTISFPLGLLTTTTGQAFSAFGGISQQNPSNKMTFGQNRFVIDQLQHWGNFRMPDAMSWNTTIQAHELKPTQNSPSSS